MSKFYEEKTSEEVTKIIAEIEAKVRAEFDMDPSKAFESLENLLKEHAGDETIKNKIKALKQEFQSTLAYREAMAKMAQPAQPQTTPTEQTPTKTTEEKIGEIIHSQSEARNALNDVVEKEGVKLANEKGEIVEKKEIREGEARESVVVQIKDQKDLERTAEKIEKVYDQFAELGFNVHKQKIEKEVEGENKTAHILAIELPSEYKGPQDPLAMNLAQIRNALDLMIAEKEARKNIEKISLQHGNIFAEILGSLELKDLTSELSFGKDEFVRKLTQDKLGKAPSPITVQREQAQLTPKTNLAELS